MSTADAPLGWLCEDLYFTGEFDFTRNAERAAHRAKEPDQWRVTPVYAKPAVDLPRSEELSFRYHVEMALIALEKNPANANAKAFLRGNAIEIAEALIAALKQPTLMVESVEGFADRMAEKHGDPNGSEYDQGQHDMAQRFKSRVFMRGDDLRLMDRQNAITEAVDGKFEKVQAALDAAHPGQLAFKTWANGLRDAAELARAEGDKMDDCGHEMLSAAHVAGQFYALANVLRAMSTGYVPSKENDS